MFYNAKFLNSFFIFLFLNTASLIHAQTGIYFQAIARDNNLNPAKDRKIFVQSNIIQSSPYGLKVFIEEHQTSTDAFGIFSIMLGGGERVGGTVYDLGSIEWAKGPFYLNLKIAITPVGAGLDWNYTKEWIDVGTTIFGTVPYALFSDNTAKIDQKLNSIDTAKMLSDYVRAIQLKNVTSIMDTKLFSKDTSAMLAPYAKISFAIDSNFLNKQLIKKLDVSDTIKFIKQNFIDSALSTKMDKFDTSDYTKNINFKMGLLTKLNIEDSVKYTKRTYTDSALLTKLTITGSAAGLTNFPILNQNTTGNAASATNALTAINITASSNTSLTSLSNLNKVGTITNGVWNGSIIDIAHGGTGLNVAGRTGQVLSTASDGTLTWTSLTTQSATHAIGESFGGGIVFYVWDNGRHGLIASTSNQSFSTKWGPTANYVMALRNGINAGVYNTERILMQQGAGNGTYAAMVAAHYQFNGNGWGGYGDWYLPSVYELQLLFKQKNLVGGFTNTTGVWSSTEADDKTAYSLDFLSTNGTVQAESKTILRCVRAIRWF